MSTERISCVMHILLLWIVFAAVHIEISLIDSDYDLLSYIYSPCTQTQCSRLLILTQSNSKVIKVRLPLSRHRLLTALRHADAALSPFLGLKLAVCHSAVLRMVDHTSSITCRYLPGFLHWYQLILLGDRGIRVWSYCASIARAGVEPATSRSLVRRSTRDATASSRWK